MDKICLDLFPRILLLDFFVKVCPAVKLIARVINTWQLLPYVFVLSSLSQISAS